MIVTDTTAISTNKKSIVVTMKKFGDVGFDNLQCVSCQHHVLDRVLKLVIDSVCPEESTSPDLHYSFV